MKGAGGGADPRTTHGPRRREIAPGSRGRWVLAVLAAFAALSASAEAHGPGAPPPAGYGTVPLGFEINVGQTDASVQFLARGSGYGLFLRRRDLVLATGRPGRPSVMRMVPVGAARRPRLSASGRLPGVTNYLTGLRGPKRVRSFRRVTYHGLYRGVDMVVHGRQGLLEYDFVLEPAASPAAIRLAFPAARKVRLSARGDLLVSTAHGTIRQRRPVAYQDLPSGRRPVAVRFRLRGRMLGFTVGSHDRSRPLVIDPVVDYGTFLGGAGGYDQASALAVDEAGSAYVAGVTFSADFPTTADGFDSDDRPQTVCLPAQDPGFEPPPAEACRSDAFITKLSPDGSRIVYSTFLGGELSDRIQDLALSRDGTVYVTGGTDSADFPVTPDAADRTFAGRRRIMGAGLSVYGESFLTRISADGSRLLHSTFLGGGDAEEAMGIGVDDRGAAYVSGHTFSPDFPTTEGAFDRALNVPGKPAAECSDVFVTKIAAGGAVPYSTLFGGSRLDFSWDLDVSPAGAAYVLAESTADDAPTTAGAFQRTGHARRQHADCGQPLEHFDDADPVVVKLARDGSSLNYSTYLGGSGHEHGLGIATHRGRAFVVGHTNSHDFPTTAGALGRQPRGTPTLFDGFVTKLAPDASSLEYSTLLAGADDDWGFGVAVDKAGSAYVAGMTTSKDFPTSDDALDRMVVGPGPPFYDAFVARLAPDGSRLLYSSYFGGSAPDVGLAIAERAGHVYLGGMTFSPDLATTSGSADGLFNGPAGYSDAFVARFSGLGPPARPAMRLSVRPMQASVGREVRLRLRTTARVDGSAVPVPDALVRAAGRRVRTNAAGRARLDVVFRKPGSKQVRSSRRGYLPAHRTINVRSKRATN